MLKRPGKTPLTPVEVDELLDFLCRVGLRRAVRFKLRPAAADPKDDLVLEAAVASGIQTIVTHNFRDMKGAATQYGIEVITPKEALTQLGMAK